MWFRMRSISVRSSASAAVMETSRMLPIFTQHREATGSRQEKPRPFQMNNIHLKCAGSDATPRAHPPKLPTMKRAQPGRRGTEQVAPRRLRAAAPRTAAAALKPAQLLALQAFDVAFRLGSFKAAASTLNLS